MTRLTRYEMLEKEEALGYIPGGGKHGLQFLVPCRVHLSCSLLLLEARRQHTHVHSMQKRKMAGLAQSGPFLDSVFKLGLPGRFLCLDERNL
jgi:hypothetical protein